MDNDNKETAKETKPGVPEGDTKAGLQSETISELDRADQIAERQKRENDRREELLIREENLEARRAVGGGSEGGQPVEKKEISPSDYADAAIRGDLNKKDD